MRSKSVAVGRTAKGYEATGEFPAKMLRSSLPLDLEGAKVFVMATAPLLERRRFVFSAGSVIGMHLQGAVLGHVKVGRRENRIPFVAGQISLMPQYYDPENYWHESYVIGQIVLSPILLKTIAEQTFEADSARAELKVMATMEDPFLWNLGVALDKELQSKGEWTRLYAESIIQTMAVHTLRRYSSELAQNVISKITLTPTVVNRICDYIQANLARNLKLGEIASQVGLSAYHLAHQFKLQTGCPLHKYMIEQRVETARRLIKAGKLSLKEIAVQVGFADQSHFTRHFKRLTGVTPARILEASRFTGRPAEAGADS